MALLPAAAARSGPRGFPRRHSPAAHLRLLTAQRAELGRQRSIIFCRLTKRVQASTLFAVIFRTSIESWSAKTCFHTLRAAPPAVLILLLGGRSVPVRPFVPKELPAVRAKVVLGRRTRLALCTALLRRVRVSFKENSTVHQARELAARPPDRSERQGPAALQAPLPFLRQFFCCSSCTSIPYS